MWKLLQLITADCLCRTKYTETSVGVGVVSVKCTCNANLVVEQMKSCIY